MAALRVRAKFKCHSMAKRTGWGGTPFHYDYKFSAVTDNNPENSSFFAATPSGEVTLTAVKDDLFEVGREYYLDFSPFITPEA